MKQVGSAAVEVRFREALFDLVLHRTPTSLGFTDKVEGKCLMQCRHQLVSSCC